MLSIIRSRVSSSDNALLSQQALRLSLAVSYGAGNGTANEDRTTVRGS